MVLDYIFTIITEVEPDVADFASSRADTICKEAQEHTFPHSH
jgi:hypothetical protein